MTAHATHKCTTRIDWEKLLGVKSEEGQLKKMLELKERDGSKANIGLGIAKPTFYLRLKVLQHIDGCPSSKSYEDYYNALTNHPDTHIVRKFNEAILRGKNPELPKCVVKLTEA